MIKSNELRIGNVYNRKHGKGWTETIIDEMLMAEIFSQSMEYALDDFEPILLTKDWLIRFGGKPLQNGYWISVTNLKAELHFEIFNNTSEIVTTIKSQFSDLILDRIKYVHQLQTLYYVLAGVELSVS